VAQKLLKWLEGIQLSRVIVVRIKILDKLSVRHGSGGAEEHGGASDDEMEDVSFP
jgi:hypothetical protein